MVSQNKEGGGGSSSSSVQILIDNETGHKKEIEERKKASKSATILRRKVTNGILRTKELGDKGNISKIAHSGSKKYGNFSPKVRKNIIPYES